MNILLTAVGRRDYILDYFKSLDDNQIKIVAVNSIKDTTAMWKAEVSYLSPEIRSKDYIPFLLEVCIKEKIDILISLFDLDTLFISYFKQLFIDIGVKPIVSDLNIVETCLDKEKMYQFLNDNKFYTPRIFDNINSVKVELDKGNLVFPLVLKPQWGQGSIATEIVYNIEELESAYSFLTSKVKNTSISHIEHLNYSNKLLIQEFIAGQEYGVDCINDLNSINRAVVVKKKLAMRAGETDAAITVEDLGIHETIERLGNTLKHISIIDIDVIKSNGKIFIIDINPRFGGGYPFSHVAGVNVPEAIINWVNNFKSHEEFFSYEKGVMSLKGINIISKTGTPW